MSRLGLFILSLWAIPSLAQSPVISVKVAELSDVLVALERRAPAEVLPLNDSLIAAEVNAVVAGVRVDVGEVVRAGDLLIELDRRDFQLQLDAAQAALASSRAREAEARAKLERALSLSKAQYISEDELLTRETALAVSSADILNAEAQVAIARRQLDKCSVLAPFDGVVQKRMAQQGAYVTVGAPLVQFTQIGQVELEAEVPEVLAASLEDASAWYFSAGELRWEVSLLRLSPVIQAGRRARPARFGFSGDAPPAGQSGELIWTVASGQLPANLISRREGALGVFLYEAETARFVPLANAQEGRPVAVSLPENSLVIIQGQDRLQDGDPVRVR